MNLESIIVAAVVTFLAGAVFGGWFLLQGLGRYAHSEKGRQALLDYFEKHKDCPRYEGMGFSHKLTDGKGKGSEC